MDKKISTSLRPMFCLTGGMCYLIYIRISRHVNVGTFCTYRIVKQLRIGRVCAIVQTSQSLLSGIDEDGESDQYLDLKCNFCTYIKTCVKRLLKNRQNKDLNDKCLLNEGRKLECSHSAILLTCIKR